MTDAADIAADQGAINTVFAEISREIVEAQFDVGLRPWRFGTYRLTILPPKLVMRACNPWAPFRVERRVSERARARHDRHRVGAGGGLGGHQLVDPGGGYRGGGVVPAGEQLRALGGGEDRQPREPLAGSAATAPRTVSRWPAIRWAVSGSNTAVAYSIDPASPVPLSARFTVRSNFTGRASAGWSSWAPVPGPAPAARWGGRPPPGRGRP